jgi:DNA uptake protein ComE-like DNA-binding protein
MFSFIKRYSGFFLLLLGIVGLIAINLFSNPVTGTMTPTFAATTTVVLTSEGYVFVDVKGAVWEPGVYRMHAGSRIDEAIAMAGGIQSDADLSTINGSQIIVDEMVLIIPSIAGEGQGAGSVCVDVKGAVKNPGVYCLFENSRVGDALLAAGGKTAAADAMSLNQAAKITDEMVIYVPTKTETQTMQTATTAYVYVRLTGAVVRTGLYYVKNTSTIAEVILLAGGLKLTGTTANLEVTAIVTADDSSRFDAC